MLPRSLPSLALLPVALVALASGPLVLSAQDAAPPEADRADVESVDAIMSAVYDVISGPQGELRDWDRFRSLFVPGARLIPTGPRQEGGGWGHRVLTPDEYATTIGPQLEARGFFEVEIGRVTERYGPVVHLMSAYESRFTSPDQVEPDARGVNSFQLFFDGDRWWVVTIFWSGETPENPIPERFIGDGGASGSINSADAPDVQPVYLNLRSPPPPGPHPAPSLYAPRLP